MAIIRNPLVVIQTGGGSFDYTDPVDVYKSTRPSEWLSMVSDGTGEDYDAMETYYETHDNEIRLLFHLYPPKDNLIAFTCTTSSGTYNVSYKKGDGTVVSTDIASGSNFEANLDYADFGNEFDKVNNVTGTGTRQVIIIITPTNSESNLLTFVGAKPTPISGSYYPCAIVDICGKCTQMNNFNLRSSSTYQFRYLRYFALFGTNSITSMEYMFQNNAGLLAVTRLYTGNCGDMGAIFSGCGNLLSFPKFDLSNVYKISDAFNSCVSLVTIPEINLNYSGSVVAGSLFYGCSRLKTVPKLNLNKVVTANFMFYNCTNLLSLEISTHNLINGNSLFDYCYSLRQLKFNPNASKCTNISLSSCYQFGYQALIDLFTSLPTISGKTITVTGTLGASSLTANDIAIATNKGWTVVYQ